MLHRILQFLGQIWQQMPFLLSMLSTIAKVLQEVLDILHLLGLLRKMLRGNFLRSITVVLLKKVRLFPLPYPLPPHVV